LPHCYLFFIISGSMTIVEDPAERERKEVRTGVITSLVIHVLAFLVLGWWLGVDAAMAAVVREMQAAAQAKKEEPAVTMLFPDQILITPPQAQLSLKKFVSTLGNTAAKAAPARADFQSDKATVASSKLATAPDGKEAMPTMAGIQAPNMMLTQSQGRLGEEPATTPSPRKPIEPDAPPTNPVPAPKPTSQMIEDLERAGSTAIAAKLPFEVKRALGATEALKPSMRAPEDGFVPATTTVMSKGTAPQGAENAVNAEATTVGGYMNGIDTGLRKRWLALLATRTKSIAGCTVTVTFWINREGKVEQPNFTAQEGPAAELANMKDLVLEAVLSTPFPPLPREILPAFPNERMPAKFDFVPL
jgi:hypothetical protein